MKLGLKNMQNILRLIIVMKNRNIKKYLINKICIDRYKFTNIKVFYNKNEKEFYIESDQCIGYINSILSKPRYVFHKNEKWI